MSDFVAGLAALAPQDVETDEAPVEDEVTLDEELDGGGEVIEEPETEADAEEEIESAPAFTVLVDGEEVEVGADEARNGYLRQADYTRKTMAVAEERKAVEQERESLGQERQQYAAILPQLKSALQSLAVQPPDIALAQTDSAAYTAQKAAYDNWRDQVTAIETEQQRIAQEQADEHQRRRADFENQQRQLLASRLPILTDEKKGRAAMEEIVAQAAREGISTDELNTVLDHRFYVILHKLAQYEKNAAKGIRKVKKAKVAAPGSGPPAGSPGKKRLHDALERQKQTGSKTDTVNALRALRGSS